MDAFLYVYTFKFFIFTLEHTEIQYGTVHAGYCPNGLRVSHLGRSMKLKRIIYAGTSDVSLQNYFRFLRDLQIITAGRKYCLFKYNCRHISYQILEKLGCHESEGISSLVFIYLMIFSWPIYSTLDIYFRIRWVYCFRVNNENIICSARICVEVDSEFSRSWSGHPHCLYSIHYRSVL